MVKEIKSVEYVLKLNDEEACALLKMCESWREFIQKVPKRKKDKEAFEITRNFLGRIMDCILDQMNLEEK